MGRTNECDGAVVIGCLCQGNDDMTAALSYAHEVDGTHGRRCFFLKKSDVPLTSRIKFEALKFTSTLWQLQPSVGLGAPCPDLTQTMTMTSTSSVELWKDGKTELGDLGNDCDGDW